MDLDWEKNLGDIDRIIRAAAGAGLAGLVLTRTLTGPWAIITSILALSQFIEASLGY